MSFLFAKAKTVIPDLTGLQIQTAVNTMPIPIIYGSPRTQMNIIYVNGFTAQKIKSGGGKGLLTGGKGSTQGYKYYATFIGALGEGQLDSILAVFDNQQVYAPGSPPSGSGKIYNFFNGGTDNSAPWTYVTALWPSDAFAYKATAYIGCDNYPLDSSGTIPQLNFLAHGTLATSSPLNLYTAPGGSTYLLDADPGQVILDFLTNPTYGVGFPLSLIDTTTLITSTDGENPAIGDAAVQTYCQAVGLAWSVVLNNAEPASSILDRWCKNLVVAPVWTGNVLKFIPYYDSYSGANPGYDADSGIPLKYYQPSLTPIFDLDDRDFQQTPQGDDPLVVSRIDVADAKNVVRVNFRDRTNLFNDNVAEAKDESGVELYGPRVDRIGTADEFSLMVYAAQSAQQKLQRNMSIRNIYEFKLGWQYCVLDPMDIVTVTDVTLGLDMFPVRIISIEEDEKGILSIVAEEFPIGSNTVSAYVRAPNVPPTQGLVNVDPRSVNTPFIFEPTTQMLTALGLTSPTVVIGMSGGPSGTFDPNWGGANVYISTDNITYSQVGPIQSGASRQGTLTATLAAFGGTNPDNSSTLSVTLAESDGELETASSVDAAAGVTICGVYSSDDGQVEILAYTTATLTGPNAYNLTGLYRGLYGTIACAKPSGSQFLRIDSQVWEAPLQSAFIGKTLYVKLQSFNIYGISPQPLSACTVYTYIPVGAGVSVAGNFIYNTLLGGGDVDLNVISAIPTPDLDLNLGGFGACAPLVFNIDLGLI